MFRHLLVGSIVTLGLANSCINPEDAFGTDEGQLDPSLLSIPEDGVYGGVVLLTTDYLGSYETPIQFRLSQIAVAVVYSTMAAFDDNALDFFARIDESNDRRRCSDNDDNDNNNDTDIDYFSLHRRVALAYSSYFGWSSVLPQEASDEMAEILESWGLPIDICNNCTLDPSHCEDISTPWGLAYTLTKEINNFHYYDGWNADGSLSREYNRIPYQDFRGDDSYIPRNDPWNLKCQRSWQPLLESNEQGFLFYQEHVVPHIGWTSKSVFLTDDEICSMKAPNPRYNYNKEIDLLLNRLANLNDTSKMEIEFFDSKLTSVLPLLLQYYLYQNENPISADSFEWITVDMMVHSVLYEVVAIVWKEKVRWDKVRPPSIVQKRKADEYITTYGGTDENDASYGTQTFLGNNFEPYIRTMPHAEYPSGSSCVCRAISNAIAYWEGSDDVTEAFGAELLAYFPTGWQPGDSGREPGSTPSTTIKKYYSTWSEIADRCGASRLDGGLHFTAAIEAGDDLCGPVGYNIAQAFERIINGERPDYVVDINDTSIRNRDC